MPQLQVPFQIWQNSTRGEKDEFFLQAGFDPNLIVVDNGTDINMVRFRQDEPIVAGQQDPPEWRQATPVMQAGDDTRDFVPVSLTGDNPVTDEFGVAPLAGAALAIAGRALRLILGGGGGRLTAAIWNSLPSIVRSALVQAGIGVGALIAFNGDIPFITLPGQGDSSVAQFDPSQEGVNMPTRHIDIQVGRNPLQPVQVVGTWVANGVTFYRLADGKLAVQNKKGRWKVWRPKKPIVLYADGASNLKTMLRADKALQKQAKSIASFLNRRAPKPRKTKKDDNPTIIVQGSGRVIDA